MTDADELILALDREAERHVALILEGARRECERQLAEARETLAADHHRAVERERARLASEIAPLADERRLHVVERELLDDLRRAVTERYMELDPEGADAIDRIWPALEPELAALLFA